MAQNGKFEDSESRGRLAYTEDDRTWASLCHFSALLGMVWWIPTSVAWLPFGHLFCPLVVWLFKRRRSPFVDRAGREALNFQIAMTAYGGVVATVLSGVYASLGLWALALTDLAFVVAAGVRWSNGREYLYPLVPFRFL
ncbi:DUF4870 domain-containing protein [Desulfoglaeba alkanexedens]|jgi:hypothetical protein|uniref:DUF4870 domain-containing protein n=1 Tax=Desulfoglaeba alkanexedens ALDC TaxID=980445 RepID=A0A4P8L0A1_9BACT|nr:DUF4870 domain-containing protein [Desulfoglaeba alkanexedens]QCQ21257.1 DUF4870 domain-containing protein [Desulfoglaeba alkanexedens ALDC]